MRPPRPTGVAPASPPAPEDDAADSRSVQVRAEPTAADALRITVARSREEVEAIRPIWERFQGDALSTDPDWFLEVLRVLPGNGRPHVMVLERNGVAEAMLVANVRRRPLPRRPRTKTLPSRPVSALAIVEQGALGRIDESAAHAFLGEILSTLDRKEADVCIIRHVPSTSPLREAVKSQVPFLRRGHGSRLVARWSRPLPDTYEAFLTTLSRGMRKSLQSTASRLERELGPRLSFEAFRDGSRLDVFFRDAESVASKTYQRSLGVGFQDDERTRRLSREAVDRGWFRGWLLYVDERPIAYEQGFVYRGTFRWTAGGFDPELAPYRPGTYSIAKVIQDLCADPDVHAVDFGLGDADYKRRLGCSARLEDDVFISAPRLRPIWMISVNSAVTVLAQVVAELF
jgi:hypothetical protein